MEYAVSDHTVKPKEPTKESFALRRARIELLKAQAVLDQATVEYERRARSKSGGAISSEEIEQTRLAVVIATCDRDLADLHVEET